MKENRLICAQCAHISHGKKKVSGSILIEIVLWICFIIPGLIYSIWRLTCGGKTVCPSCGSKNLLRLDSPMGVKLVIETGQAKGEVA